MGIGIGMRLSKGICTCIGKALSLSLSPDTFYSLYSLECLYSFYSLGLSLSAPFSEAKREMVENPLFLLSLQQRERERERERERDGGGDPSSSHSF